MTALMAPSGAARRRCCASCWGLETADSGEITGLSGKRLAAVFQEDRLLDFMTPVDNIRLPEPKLERVRDPAEMAAMGLTGCENQPGAGAFRRHAAARGDSAGAALRRGRDRAGRAVQGAGRGDAGARHRRNEAALPGEDRADGHARGGRGQRNMGAKKIVGLLDSKGLKMLCYALQNQERKRCALYGKYEHGNHDERASRHRL